MNRKDKTGFKSDSYQGLPILHSRKQKTLTPPRGADYGSTVASYLQPLSSDILLASEAGWEIRPYGIPVDPMPTVGRLSNDVNLGVRSSGGSATIPEPDTLPLFITGILLWLLSSRLAHVRQPRPMHGIHSAWNGGIPV